MVCPTLEQLCYKLFALQSTENEVICLVATWPQPAAVIEFQEKLTGPELVLDVPGTSL